MRPLYERAYWIDQGLPVVVVYGPDLEAGAGDAEAKITPQGVAHLQLRSDYPNAFDVAERARDLENTSNHEFGHLRAKQLGEPYEAFYKMRGFRGTAAQARIEADAMGVGPGWQWQPREQWAETYGAALSGRWTKNEKTFDDGKPIGALAARAWFLAQGGRPLTYPIVWAPSPYFSRGWFSPPKNIALHSAATTLASLLQTFTSPTSTRKVSAHFTVDGFTRTIYQHVDLSNRAWHAIDANEFAIGIETIDGKAWGIHPEITYDMTAWLIRTLIAPTLGLPVNDEVIGPHSRWVATACPAYLDVARIITAAGGISEVPTEAQWQQHLADEANAHTAVRNVLAQLAHAKHPATITINPHVLDPNIRAALKKLDQAVVTQQKHAAQAKRKGTAASARVGHGRGTSKDVED